jgi:hypothetical protein
MQAIRHHNMKIANKSLKVSKFKYLEMTVTHQNYTHGEIKLNLGNAYYHLVQNILSSHLLSNIKIHKTIILSVVLYKCETWSLIKGRNRLGAGCQGKYLALRESQ